MRASVRSIGSSMAVALTGGEVAQSSNQDKITPIEVIFLLVTDFREGTGCPDELDGGPAILTVSAIISGVHPKGGPDAGGRAFAQARTRPQDDLHPLLRAGV